jgi:putative SOS response-associated peptidase YedK
LCYKSFFHYILQSDILTTIVFVTSPNEPKVNRFVSQSSRKRRCLIIADGYYEWKSDPDKINKKSKYFFQLPSREPFAFAGLWSTWQKDYHGFTIITRDAVGEIRRYLQTLHKPPLSHEAVNTAPE